MPIILMNCWSSGAASAGSVTPQAFTIPFGAGVGDGGAVVAVATAAAVVAVGFTSTYGVYVGTCGKGVEVAGWDVAGAQAARVMEKITSKVKQEKMVRFLMVNIYSSLRFS
jgi:hypothetical protein